MSGVPEPQLLSVDRSWQHRTSPGSHNPWRTHTDPFPWQARWWCRCVFCSGCFPGTQGVEDARLSAWCCSHGWVSWWIRYQVLGLRIKLEGRYFFNRILLLILNTNALVDHWKLACTYLFSYVISCLNRLALIKLQKLHPLFQNVFISEKKLLLLITLISVTNMYSKASFSLENTFDSQTLQTNNFKGVLGTIGLTDGHDGVMKE